MADVVLPSTHEIDADLLVAGFRNDDPYPEYGYSSLRDAYEAGFETATFRAEKGFALSVGDLQSMPVHTALLFADGVLREVRRNARFGTHLRAFNGSEVINDLRIATLLPATVVYIPNPQEIPDV